MCCDYAESPVSHNVVVMLQHWKRIMRIAIILVCSGFHTGFFERGGNSWLTYLASNFGRLEMSRVPFAEQVLDIFKQKNRLIEL